MNVRRIFRHLKTGVDQRVKQLFPKAFAFNSTIVMYRPALAASPGDP